MNVLDLFSGACGGWSLGLHRAGFRTVAACEIEEWRRQRFAYNFPDAKLYDDVRTLTGARLKDDGVPAIRIVAGSPPCQDASAANSIKGGQGIDGERTGLFWEALRLVRELRPDWVCLENVPPLRTKGYDRIHDALDADGYACRPLVVEAACAGAPHLRALGWKLPEHPMARPSATKTIAVGAACNATATFASTATNTKTGNGKYKQGRSGQCSLTTARLCQG